MECFKKFLSLLLVFSITIQPMAMAQVDPDADENINPFTQNPPGTPAGVTCTTINEKPGSSGVCCQGLTKNFQGYCDEIPFTDPALVKCDASTICQDGTGCYPQRADDLFSILSPSTESDEAKGEKRDAITGQLEDTLKSANSDCAHARECASYSCIAGKCEDRNVCRKAGENEIAAAGVDCGSGLVKSVTGKCELSPEAKNPVYLGLLRDANIEAKGQCQFKLPEETKLKSIIAMRSLRAMEFFFSTANLQPDEDCFKITPYIKDQIGVPFREARKTILTNFTDVLNDIEKDYRQLLSAKEKSDKMLSIHAGEAIKEGDLATRQTSGYDTMMILYRRNNLMQSLESSMLETVKQANTSLIGINKNMGEWSGGSSSWKLGDQNIEAYNCNGSKYKKRVILVWKTKYYKKIKDRWANYWEVTGNAAGNSDIVKRDLVKKHLALISGSTEAQVEADFTANKYYMMDPMMYAGMKQGSYGSKKKLKKSGGFAVFGGFKDLRHAYYIKGDGTGSFTSMHSSLKAQLEAYYKGMKTKQDQRGFIYEPELLTTEAKDCLDNPQNGDACKDFQPFLDGVLDESFANFLAWGHSKKDSYDNYFSDATTYRRKLLSKMEVDMQNIQKYYEELIQHREKQNACIEKVMNGLIKNDILVDGSGGIEEGGVPITGFGADPSSVKGATQALAASQKARALKGAGFNSINRSRFQFDLRQSLASNKTPNAFMDNAAGTGNSSAVGSGGVGNTNSALLAIRNAELKKANDKAGAAGVNVADKEKAVKGVIDSMKGGAALASAGAGGASAFGGAKFGSSDIGDAKVSGGAGSGKSSEDALNSDDKNKNNTAQGIDSGANSGLGGITSGYGSGSGNGEGAQDATAGASDPNAKDGTGLTDAERERLLAEAEKRRLELADTEGDELFRKVSKAYVRNLDKVLNKKKKID